MTLDLGPVIDEHHNIRVQRVHDWLRRHPFPGLLDVIVAYSSVSVFYDPAVLRASGAAGHLGAATGGGSVAGGGLGAAAWVGERLTRAWEESEAGAAALPGQGPDEGVCADYVRAEGVLPLGMDHAVRPAADGTGSPARARNGHSFRIPVCYEGVYAPDLEEVARRLGLSVQAVIELHSAAIYRVYMIGFLPGFPYLGILDQRLETPRKMRPVPVAAGGVGIAGRQTGIYPLHSPGGWSIIGRTPIRLFDAGEDPPVRLQTGDRVEFYPIPTDEFRRLSGRPV